METRLVSVKDASKIFGIGVNRLRDLLESDPTVPYIHIGTHKKINTALFTEWLNKATLEGKKL